MRKFCHLSWCSWWAWRIFDEAVHETKQRWREFSSSKLLDGLSPPTQLLLFQVTQLHMPRLLTLSRISISSSGTCVSFQLFVTSNLLLSSFKLQTCLTLSDFFWWSSSPLSSLHTFIQQLTVPTWPNIWNPPTKTVCQPLSWLFLLWSRDPRKKIPLNDKAHTEAISTSRPLLTLSRSPSPPLAQLGSP